MSLLSRKRRATRRHLEQLLSGLDTMALSTGARLQVRRMFRASSFARIEDRLTFGERIALTAVDPIHAWYMLTRGLYEPQSELLR